MVADDVLHLGMAHIAGHVGQVIEALVALGVPGTLIARQQLVDLGGHVGGVDHHVLGAAGMDGNALDLPLGGGGVEGLVLDLTHGGAIGGIGQLRAEPFQIQ